MNRQSTRRAVIGALAGVLPACLRQGNLKGGKSVSSLELTLSASRTEVVCGESLALRAVLLNRTTEPVQVQTFPHTPIVFEFREPGTGAVRFRCSQADFHDALSAGMQMPPPPPARFVALAPGQSHTFHADPALYLRGNLPPGAWLLAAHLTGPGYEVRSSPVEVRVSALRAGKLSTAYCVYGHAMLALFDHTDAAGTPWLLYRETSSGVQVEAAVATRFERASAPIQDAALSIHAAPEIEGRWVAWLEQGMLKARRLWADAVAARPAAAAAGLDDLRLAQPGFHLVDGSGLFILAGMAAGEAHVRFLRARDDTLGMATPAPLKAALPARLLAQCLQNGRQMVLWLAWAQETGGLVKFFARPFDFDGAPLLPGPREVYSREARLLAFELAAFGSTRPPFAHALIQVPPRDQLLYVRAPLEGDAPPQQFRVAAPPGAPSAWAISGYETGGLLLLAAIEDRTWVASARGRAWQPLTPPVGRIDRLHLLASSDDYWGALWLDPATGLRALSDPEYRARE